MLILGVDPGIGRCGWGVVEQVTKSKLKVLSYGCIETKANGDIGKRLKEIHDQLSSIFKKYKPQALAVEEIFFNTNAKSALIVGQARGIVLLLAAQNKIPIHVYTPLQVKVALTGYGRAEKAQIGKMVQILLSLKEIPKLDDTADALAVAVTHAFSYNGSGYDRVSSRNR
jgi:crossover junction endodeoxyribonuclease RuvC